MYVSASFLALSKLSLSFSAIFSICTDVVRFSLSTSCCLEASSIFSTY
uniref:Uncharacterized protein n=1 Tax=Arundo donax TaxID=35708 RepID=A0A0A9HH44_ARUDO